MKIECDRILGCGGEGLILKLKYDILNKGKYLAFKFTKCKEVNSTMGDKKYFGLLKQLGEYNAALVGLGDYLAFGLSDIFGIAYYVIGKFQLIFC